MSSAIGGAAGADLLVVPETGGEEIGIGRQ